VGRLPSVRLGRFGTVLVLVLVAVARHWAFGRQWAAILGVLLLQCVLMFAFWKGH
jgi:uncharacterized membrane protein